MVMVKETSIAPAFELAQTHMAIHSWVRLAHQLLGEAKDKCAHPDAKYNYMNIY